jgi:DNA-binding XRE family transcriptional regulator/quercetin dioxygenase-like cupin family protein
MPPDLGDRLRAARQAQNLTTRQLARTLGVSPALVGHIETGRTLPSINTLYAIATVLKVSLDQLFALDRSNATGNDRPAATGGVLVGRHNARPHRLSGPGARWESLTSPEQDFQFGLLTYDAGASTTEGATPLGHEGTEHGYLLSGTLELTVGEAKYILNTGDSFELDARAPHAWLNPGPHPMHLLWALNPHPSPPDTGQ